MRSSLLLYGLLAYAGLQAVLVTAQEPRDRIMFPHVTHVEDMDLECGECHEGLATSTRLTHDLLPVMDQCSACHDGDTAPEECSACHTRPDDPATYTWQPIPGLLFPHQTHLAEAMVCDQCHPGKAGSEALVKLRIAEALQGKRIILLPVSEGGMNLKTTDINRLIEMMGIKSLGSKR